MIEIEEAWWQKVADRMGVSILVMPHRQPSHMRDGEGLPYAVEVDQADAWEQKNAVLTLTPRIIKC